VAQAQAQSETDDEAERGRERGLAALRANQIKPGERRNPLGISGSRVRATVLRFMEDTEGERKRVETVLQSMFEEARGGSEPAARLLIEQGYGRAGMGAAEWQLAIAEHIRKVARDQAELALGLLGNRIHTMSDEEKAAFFQRCSVDARGFLAAAEAELASRDGRGPPAIEAQASPVEGESPPEPTNEEPPK
jgi:hypothetical protein